MPEESPARSIPIRFQKGLFASLLYKITFEKMASHDEPTKGASETIKIK
jgi:hypothetical protein